VGLQILGHQPPVALRRAGLAAQQAGPVEQVRADGGFDLVSSAWAMRLPWIWWASSMPKFPGSFGLKILCNRLIYSASRRNWNGSN